ncbi:thioredoxin family protein [Bacillus tianshenii]|nr:thioredoxin family protein [Bacillus tianshenii]
MKTIQSKEMFTQAQNDGKAIFLFSADWCPDCRVIEPILPEIEEKYNSFTFYYVDRDDHIDLCAEMDIFGIPSFVAFENGKELGRFVSKDRKTQEQIEQFIESL